jgi:hypothetical protein
VFEPMMFDCQPKRDPGAACSRLVRQLGDLSERGKLTLSRNQLILSLHRCQHLRNLIPNLVLLTLHSAVKQVSDSNKFERHLVAVRILIGVLRLASPALRVTERRTWVTGWEVNDPSLAKSPLA